MGSIRLLQFLYQSCLSRVTKIKHIFELQARRGSFSVNPFQIGILILFNQQPEEAGKSSFSNILEYVIS